MRPLVPPGTHRLPALQLRPLTHDLMKNTLEALGFRVTKVRITALVGNTYHARVHYARSLRPGGKTAQAAAEDGLPAEVDVDARPSGARPAPPHVLSWHVACQQLQSMTVVPPLLFSPLASCTLAWRMPMPVLPPALLAQPHLHARQC